jgi:hypothetical protein
MRIVWMSSLTKPYDVRSSIVTPPPLPSCTHDKMPPLRGAKLSAVEDRIWPVNFIEGGLFTITGGRDVKGLKNAIIWCWETGSKMPGSVESYQRTAAEHLLGLYCTLRTI